MTSDNTLEAGLSSDEQKFRTFLKSFSIVDIGMIQYIKDGKATVATNIFIKGKQVIYDGVEVVYPGNDQGVFGAATANCTCLIFIPRTCMPSIRDKVVKHGELCYSKNGIKAMPIGNSIGNNVRTQYDGNGNLIIATGPYTLLFQNDSITYQRKDNGSSLTIDESGNMYVVRQGANGVYRETIEDGIVKTEWTTKDNDVKWTDVLNADGSRSFTQINPQQQSDNVMFSFSVAADGTVSFTMAQGLTLKTKGDLVLTGASVAISATGTEEGQGNVTVDSATNKQVQVNGTNLTVDK